MRARDPNAWPPRPSRRAASARRALGALVLGLTDVKKALQAAPVDLQEDADGRYAACERLQEETAAAWIDVAKKIRHAPGDRVRGPSSDRKRTGARPRARAPMTRGFAARLCR